MLIIALIRGSIMLIAFLNGVPLHTFRDISVNVLNVAFDFVIPLIGGIMLVAAGVVITNTRQDTYSTTKRRAYTQKLKTQKYSIIGKMLNDNDRAILSLLSKSNTMLQSDIVSLSGFSKVKVHRILRKLENMGIVKTSRFGITNRIILTTDKSSAFSKKA